MLFRNNRAFTLIEILTVLAIIGILAAILIPTTGKALESVRKTKDASNLRQVSLAYMSYSLNHAQSQTINQPTIYAWITTLASHATALTPNVSIFNHDPLVQQSREPAPKRIRLDKRFASYRKVGVIQPSKPRGLWRQEGIYRFSRWPFSLVY